jgi:hypothetical protein
MMTSVVTTSQKLGKQKNPRLWANSTSIGILGPLFIQGVKANVQLKSSIPIGEKVEKLAQRALH